VRYTVALIAVLLAAPALAQEPTSRAPGTGETRSKVEISSGVNFERGDFGTASDIEKTTIPLTIGVAKGRVRASAQLPWVRVTAPANVIAPAGPLGLPILVDPTRPSTRSTRQGLGDLRVNAAYDLPVPASSPACAPGPSCRLLRPIRGWAPERPTTQSEPTSQSRSAR
jgi:hypothetical protein